MKNEQKNKTKLSVSVAKNLLIGAVTLLCVLPLAAQEQSKVKLNLPDGVYQVGQGCVNGFVVKDNKIYTHRKAIEIFDIAPLNNWFADTRYQILFGGEKVGEGYFSRIPSDLDVKKMDACEPLFSFDKSKPSYISKEKISEHPLYVKNPIFRRNGSPVRLIIVPNEYKETPKKVHRILTQEEVSVVEKNVKDKLLVELKNKKELEVFRKSKLARFKLADAVVARAELVSLDKLNHHGRETYIGVYYYIFKSEIGRVDYRAVFSTIGDKVKFITANVERINGMLDVDACGDGELVVEKGYGYDDESVKWVEIYKQKADGSWAQIFKSEEVRTAL